jgi:hypothetical protein
LVVLGRFVHAPTARLRPLQFQVLQWEPLPGSTSARCILAIVASVITSAAAT